MLGGSCEGMQCIHHAAIVRVNCEAMHDSLAQACARADLCVVCKRRESAMCDYSASASKKFPLWAAAKTNRLCHKSTLIESTHSPTTSQLL